MLNGSLIKQTAGRYIKKVKSVYKFPLVILIISAIVSSIIVIPFASKVSNTESNQLLDIAQNKLTTRLETAISLSSDMANHFKSNILLTEIKHNQGQDKQEYIASLQPALTETLLKYPHFGSLGLIVQTDLTSYNVIGRSREAAFPDIENEDILMWYSKFRNKHYNFLILSDVLSIHGKKYHLLIHDISSDKDPVLLVAILSGELINELTADSVLSSYRIFIFNRTWEVFLDSQSNESILIPEQQSILISALKQKNVEINDPNNAIYLENIGSVKGYRIIHEQPNTAFFRIALLNESEAVGSTYVHQAYAWTPYIIILTTLMLLISLISNRILLSPIAKIVKELQFYQQHKVVNTLPVNRPGKIGLLARNIIRLIDEVESRSKVQELAIEEASSASLKLQAVLTSMVDAVINIDEQGIILTFNHSAEQMFGYHANEVIGKNVSMLMPVDYAEKHDGYLAEYIRTGKQNITQSGRELPAVRKGGDTFSMFLSVSEVETIDGKLYTGLIRDISETKMLEAERNRVLESSKELAWRLDFALSEPRIGVWDYDAKTKVFNWDKRMFLLYGEDIEGGKEPIDIWHKAIHPKDRKSIERSIEKSVLTGVGFKHIFRIILPNMIVNHIEAHAKAIYDETGNITGLVGTNRDVTEEQLLQELKQQALDMAEDSLKLKSEFLASMSHEIRTPMNGVLGMLGLLKQTTLKDRQLHYVELASSSAHSLLNLINDILDFSKIEAGKLELEILDFDLRSQLGEVAESLALKAQEKDIEIVLDVNDVNVSMIQSDPTRIRQIVSNLLSNAIKFTEQGEIVIRARLEEAKSAQQKLICSVSDSGIGIPADKVLNLFESFTQVDASTTRQYGGTGLGLAIVKQLCVLMGGDINVKSELGVGSIFEFSVEVKASHSHSIMMPTAAIKGANILVVDDNNTNIEVLATQLKQWGANVAIAYNAKDALKCVENHEDNYFDVAILDMQMPHMDGAELGKKLNDSDQCQNTKLIMMTSMGTTGDAQYFSDLGFSAYFPKPATTSDLFDALTVVLDNSEALKSAMPLVTHQHLQTLIKPVETKEVVANMNILLVEDNRINQAVVNGMLESWGIQADVANDGEEAIDTLLSTEKYDIILMDCQMPKKDGYQTTQDIRSGIHHSINREIPIIAMTANAMKGDKEKCLAAGMSDYISKPVCADVLKAKLDKWRHLIPTKKNGIVSVKSDTLVNKPYIASYTNENEASNEEKLIVWDKKGLLLRVRHNEVLADKLTSMYLKGASESINTLLIAINTKNYRELTAISHKIKGSVRNIGGVKLGALAHEMELASKQGNVVKIDELKYAFEHAFHEFSEELKGE